MSTIILGISAYYHDSAAAIVINGEIAAAAQEERFSRRKHDASFPRQAIEYCLEKLNIRADELDAVIFYDKPLIKFERLLETYLAYAPKGIRSFVRAMPVWLKEKLFLKATLKKELSKLGKFTKTKPLKIMFSEHHQSHAASAFFPSPFKKAAVMCLDGVGEWATTSVWLGEDNKITPQWEIRFPHSLGLLYSAFTYYTGFKVNSGEYKLMGLAPYGNPVYVETILKNLIDIKEDGSFRINMKYFDYATGLTMTNRRFNKLFGGAPRKPESTITQKEMDIASSIQVVTEEIVLRLARTVHKELDVDYLCLAGGVALNCVANGRLLREGPFKDIWIQPAAGDAGGALGAALLVWHEYYEKQRVINQPDSMKGAYLGPSYSSSQIADYLDLVGAKYQILNEREVASRTAELLVDQNIVGWFQGKMEFGPRALGGRSILGDPRNVKTQSVMNQKIKYRESFRPFAPIVKYDKVSEWFNLDRASPYMLIVAPVREEKRYNLTDEEKSLFGIAKLNVQRSDIPAVTHVDYSARIQTVRRDDNPCLYALLDEFEKRTGCPVLVNTSFNVRGEPIVCSPEDAYRCFMRTDMDYLIMENILLDKTQQSLWEEESDWRSEFQLD